MKFAIEYTDVLEDKKLVYRKDEVAFDTEPWLSYGSNFNICIHRLGFEVIGEDNRIGAVNGYCGIDFFTEFDAKVPICRKGILKVLDKVEIYNIGYDVKKDKRWPYNFDKRSGWFCLGDPCQEGQAVEFMNNCIAVIDENQELIAMWLKPEFI